MGSSVSLFNALIEIIFSLNSLIIFFALSSINSKSLSSNFTSSKIIYLALLNISYNVFALFLRKVNEGLILVSFSGLIFSL